MQLQIKRVLRLKGVAGLDTLAKALRLETQTLSNELAALVAAGTVGELSRGFTLTKEGRAGLSAELDAERSSLDSQHLQALYDRFCNLNQCFKALMKDWQIRSVNNKEVPNDHTDTQYDGQIVERLAAIDVALQPILAELVASVPRLQAYPARFADALAAVQSGDRTMMAAPIKDSYHTLWFELHEEFIDLCGTTRAKEAAAGRGD